MATKATGPLGNLTEGSTYYLIELFESHKELWDFRIPQYRNKQLKNSLWLSMQISFSSTTGIDCTVGHIQAKIASLRNTFSREIRKINKAKMIGGGARDVFSSWPFFQHLKFLLPASSNLETHVMNHQQQSEEDHLYQCQSEEEFTEIYPEGAKEDDPVLSLTSSPCELRSEYPGAGKRPEKRPQKDQKDELVECIIDYCRNKKRPKEDPEFIWAKNLIQRISELPDIKQRKLIKLDIDDLVSKALRQNLVKDH